MLSVTLNGEVRILLELSVAMMAGLLMSRLAKKINLPAVTAYLVAGILIGPCCLGMLGLPGIGFSSFDNVAMYTILSDAALGFIAFSIGNEFRLEDLKKIGKSATVIAIVGAIGATLVVDIVLIICYFAFWRDVLPIYACITLGAIASATAPAATLMVVRQYKAKGPVTQMLLPVVAIDDAVGLVVFAVSFGIAKTLAQGTADLVAIIINPLIEIVSSLLLGALMGWLFTKAEQMFHSRSKRLSISVTFVLLTVAISMIKIDLGRIIISFSSLLTCMMLGTVFCNICDFSKELMERSERWSTPLLVLFFVLSGAELNLRVFASLSILAMGVVYILSRSAGKILGANLSSTLMDCEPTVKKYLGITLLPQAGVALGMSQQAKELGANGEGELIRSIVLIGILVYELLGPTLTRMALTKAGEIIPEHRTSARGGKVR